MTLHQQHFARDMLATLGCTPIETLKQRPDRQVFKIRTAQGVSCCLKIYPPSSKTLGGVAVHKTLLSNARGPFWRLVLPETLSCGQIPGMGSYILMDWVEGQSYEGHWSERLPETAGGRSIPFQSAEWVVDLIEDLGRIPCDALDTSELTILGPPQIKHVTSVCLSKAAEADLITARQAGRIREIFDEFTARCENRPLMLSNGDFQFRNFIAVDAARTALIDWDAARLSPFEREHCVAYQWLLMWNNPRWQARFLSEAKARLALDETLFRGALLLNTLKQAMLVWSRPTDADLRLRQMDFCLNVLDDRDFEHVWRVD
jgi:hypothetical protein